MDEEREVRALLADVAEIGPFFAVATGPAPAGGGWVALRDLARPADPTGNDPLGARIAVVREALGTDARVAASTVFQGLAAQVVAPLFASVAVAGALPATATWGHEAPLEAPATATWGHEAPDVLYWRPGGAGPWLWWSGDGRVVACPDGATLGDVLIGLLAPLVAAVRARVSVAERVLWSDVASAVASARSLVGTARPAAAKRATALAGHLLTVPPLAVTAALRAPTPPDRNWTFRRRSCCLYYRAPGGDVCGDCVLLDRKGRGGPPARPRGRLA